MKPVTLISTDLSTCATSSNLIEKVKDLSQLVCQSDSTKDLYQSEESRNHRHNQQKMNLLLFNHHIFYISIYLQRDTTVLTILSLLLMQLLFYCFYSGLFIDQMAESEQKQKHLEQTGEKQQDRSEDHAEDLFSQNYFDDDLDSEDLDLESTYLNRLRIQRKRIQELSLSLSISRQRYEEEVALRKSLEQQLQKYQNEKISSYSYEEITIQMDTIQQENERFKSQVQQLKGSIFDVTAECAAKLQKLTNQYNSQIKKDQAKIEALQEQLAEREDDVERLEKELKSKQRQYNELSAQTSSKINKVKDQYEERLKVEQKKLEKYIQEKVSRSNITQELESQLASTLKQNQKLKEENFKLGKFIEEREKELLHQIEKYKGKISGLKKQLKTKQKQYDDIRANLTKYERERRDQTTEKEELKVQVTKITEQYQTILARKDSDFYVEKRNMKSVIDEQGKAIGQLMAAKESCLARIRQLQAIVKRHEDKAKSRKHFLKDEMREIDKLEKVIDKIVE